MERNLGKIIAITLISLTVIGLIVLASASVVMSQEYYSESFYFVRHQMIFGLAIGLIAFYIGYRVPVEIMHKVSPLFLAIAIILLVLVLIPGLGYSYGGANRWISAGPISFQPSEPAKLAIIIYLAAWLAKHKDNVTNVRNGVVPFIIILGVISFLILLQPDISTLLLIAAVSGLIYLFAGGRVSHMLVLALSGVIVIGGYIALDEARLERVQTFLDPTTDLQGAGYQVNQSLIAIGSGGVVGKGFGNSQQKYNYLPEPIGDSIYAIMAEELGFIGASFLILVYLFIGYIGYEIVRRTKETFPRLLAFGIISLILLQAFVNIGVVTATIPFTGMTLPYISYGSSSLITFLAAAGILTQIAKRVSS